MAAISIGTRICPPEEGKDCIFIVTQEQVNQITLRVIDALDIDDLNQEALEALITQKIQEALEDVVVGAEDHEHREGDNPLTRFLVLKNDGSNALSIDEIGEIVIGEEPIDGSRAYLQMTHRKNQGFHIQNLNKVSSAFVNEGIATVGHDMFLRSGFEDGFGDASSHFHLIWEIDRAIQAENFDISRLQAFYGARPDLTNRNGRASRFTNNIASSQLQGTTIPTGRGSIDSSVPTAIPRPAGAQIVRDTSVVITMNNGAHGLSIGDYVRLSTNPQFPAAIVAGSYNGVVNSVSGAVVGVTLSAVSLKSSSEVPTSEAPNHTAIPGGDWRLARIDVSQRIGAGNELTVSLVATGQLHDEVVEVAWSSPHGLVLGQSFTLLVTSPANGFVAFNEMSVVDESPNGDTSKIHARVGRIQTSQSLTGGLPSGDWAAYRGIVDGLHKATLGSQLFTFWVNELGIPKAFQIGSNAIADADCASIGENVYNDVPESMRIGYDKHSILIKEGTNGGTSIYLKSPNGVEHELRVTNAGNVQID